MVGADGILKPIHSNGDFSYLEELPERIYYIIIEVMKQGKIPEPEIVNYIASGAYPGIKRQAAGCWTLQRNTRNTSCSRRYIHAY